MKFYIVIPAHNEQGHISKTLDSLANQTKPPKQVVVVDDHSTDKTSEIVENLVKEYPWLKLVKIKSSRKHAPGAKIVQAFYRGFETLDEDYDVICKYDADLIFPSNYLEQLAKHFETDSGLGMVSGHCYIEKEGNWVLENLTRKDHIRGALKAYRKACFLEIDKLKISMGWDTVDELLAKYYGWNILTDSNLRVKHLRPTGGNYNRSARYLQGEAMYKMRYGFWISMISSIKMALNKGNLGLCFSYMKGYVLAKRHKTPFIVTVEEGQFIRKLRWNGIKKRVI